MQVKMESSNLISDETHFYTKAVGKIASQNEKKAWKGILASGNRMFLCLRSR